MNLSLAGLLMVDIPPRSIVRILQRTMLLCFMACLLLLQSCAPEVPKQALDTLEQIRQQHAPDKRVAIWDIELIATETEALLVKGQTNLPEAKQRLFDALNQQNLKLTDSVVLLPQAVLGDAIYGLTALSVSNMRAEPRHSAELSTQTLLGMPLNILQKEGSWYRVQSPDAYLGWMDEGGFILQTPGERQAWELAPKWVVHAEFAMAYAAPSTDSTVQCDLLAGNVLQRRSETAPGWAAAILPDGRACWIPADAVMAQEEWRTSIRAEGEDLLSTGLKHLGRPYLWGGTSGKGMDCSGFTKIVALRHGLELPRDASQQIRAGHPVMLDSTLSELLPGDLIFFGPEEERITHVAFYLGEGRILHASGRVKIESLRRGEPDFAKDRFNTLRAARRIVGD